MKTKMTGVKSVEIKTLNSRDLLAYVEQTRDQDAFDLLFARMEDMVRQDIFNAGSEVRNVYKLPTATA